MIAPWKSWESIRKNCPKILLLIVNGVAFRAGGPFHDALPQKALQSGTGPALGAKMSEKRERSLWTRRKILLGIGAGLAAVGGLTSRVITGEPAGGYRVLDEESVRICRVLSFHFIGPEFEKVDVVREVDKTLEALPEIGDLWKRLPRLLENSTLADGHFGVFTALEEKEQEAVLMAWATSSLLARRQIYHGLRDLLLSHYYFSPASWPSIGYGGPWVERYPLPVHPPRFEAEVQE
jgi:hypothetical protein